MKKTIAVIGSTGLVGRKFIEMLLPDSRIKEINSFSRRPTKLSHPKLIEHIVDFDHIQNWANKLKGNDILFSAMGTTKAKAGSIKAQRKIDYDYQFEVAQAACEQQVGCYLLISSAYASPDSKLAYPKMKGELERDIELLGFEKLRILRPGPLMGKREESRPFEALTVRLFKHLPLVSGLESVKPVPATQVAQAAFESIWDEGPQVKVLEAKDIWGA